jgi:hypothetical protein
MHMTDENITPKFQRQEEAPNQQGHSKDAIQDAVDGAHRQTAEDQASRRNQNQPASRAEEQSKSAGGSSSADADRVPDVDDLTRKASHSEYREAKK